MIEGLFWNAYPKEPTQGTIMMEQTKATKPYQGKQEKGQKEEHEHMKDHTILTA